MGREERETEEKREVPGKRIKNMALGKRYFGAICKGSGRFRVTLDFEQHVSIPLAGC